jgi:hypothetical protein
MLVEEIGDPAEHVNAALRLVRLLDEPHHQAALAPLIKREILWRQIRLQEARLLLSSRPNDVTGVAEPDRHTRDGAAGPVLRLAVLSRTMRG